MKKLVKLLCLTMAVFMMVGMFAACAPKDDGTTPPDTTAPDTTTPDTTTPDTTTPDTTTPDTTEPDPNVTSAKDTVIIATADETPSVSSAGHNAVAGDYVNKLVYNALFRMDKNLNPVPDLVKEYSVEKDENGEETIWMFTLHDNVKFHDGTDMTAEDVVASIEYAKTMPEVSQYTAAVETIEAVDTHVVKITTEAPSASLLYDLCHHGNAILPKALIDSDNDFNTNPIGTGPYVFKAWKRGEQLEFEAFADYFDASRAPKIKNVIWKIIPEGASRTLALEAGDVDYVIELDSTSANMVESNPELALMKISSVSHNWLCINNEKEPFDNVFVRKAINAAIDKQSIIEVALNGNGIVATSQTPVGMLGEYTDGYDAYDPELAKEYLKDWGGDPSTITLDIICSNDTKRRAAEVVQANLDEIGITATISSMDLSTYLSETAAGNFTGFIGGYTSNEMMSFLKGVYLSSNIGASNKTRTNNPELDALIIKATQTVDDAAREKVLQEATKLLNENCYQIPIYQDYTVSAHNAKLSNTFITAGGTFYVCEWYWAE